MWRIKRWSKKQQIIFAHKPNLPKNISMDILSKEFKPIALEVIQFENRHTNNIICTFCMFSLSTFQSKGHNQIWFHLRKVQNDVTLNSDIDRRILRGCFGEGRFDLSRWNFCHIWSIGTPNPMEKTNFKIFRNQRINRLLQVKIYRLTPWKENEAGRAEETWD